MLRINNSEEWHDCSFEQNGYANPEGVSWLFQVNHVIPSGFGVYMQFSIILPSLRDYELRKVSK